MNTSFLVARPATTVRDALALVRNEAWKAELIYYLYIVEGEDRLRGVVTLRHMLMADGETPMFDLMRENPLTVTADTRIKKVARIFFKYNFEAVPVVDDEGRIQGIVTMRDTLESVFPEVREESKG
jgi:magnesium transporter